MSNINKRHRLAQMAGRASVEFYVGLALQGRLDKLNKASSAGPIEIAHQALNGKQKDKLATGSSKRGIREEAFVIRVFQNGLAVFVSK